MFSMINSEPAFGNDQALAFYIFLYGFSALFLGAPMALAPLRSTSSWQHRALFAVMTDEGEKVCESKHTLLPQRGVGRCYTRRCRVKLKLIML